MRSHIMTMKRSSLSEQSKFTILLNELAQQIEVQDADIEIGEKVRFIDHFTRQ